MLIPVAIVAIIWLAVRQDTPQRRCLEWHVQQELWEVESGDLRFYKKTVCDKWETENDGNSK